MEDAGARASHAGLAGGSAPDELLASIHRPGWTTVAGRHMTIAHCSKNKASGRHRDPEVARPPRSKMISLS